MKKKIYFIISSIIQIVVSIYFILNVDSLIQSEIQSLTENPAILPAEIQQEQINILTNENYKIGLIFCGALGIIFNVLTLCFAFKNAILRKKGLIITFSVANFFLSGYSISMILSLANFIVILCLKRKNPEDFPVKEKKEIPHLEYEKSTKKEIILGIVLILAYFSQALFDIIIPEGISEIAAMAIVISYYLILFVLAIFCFWKRLKKDFKLFKDNFKAYRQFILPRLGIMYAIYLTVSMICIIATQQASTVNQTTLEAGPQWFIIPLAIIWAPIVEEAVFRGVLRRFIKNKKLFVVLSAIAFGLIHTVSEATLVNMIVLAIPYAILGGFFAYIYSKTENITTNIFAHAFHNTIAMIVSLTTAFIIF